MHMLYELHTGPLSWHGPQEGNTWSEAELHEKLEEKEREVNPVCLRAVDALVCSRGAYRGSSPGPSAQSSILMHVCLMSPDGWYLPNI